MNVKKRRYTRVLAAVLVLLMMMSSFSLLVNAAEEEGVEYPISGYNPGEKCYDPIPLLVIMINFDADGDGVDDNPTGATEDYMNISNKDKPQYGEQWCHTTEADWVSRLFSSEGNTLNTYYKYMSGDKFWWIPAAETYGEANNGVIAVTIDNVHPNCNGASGNWVHCYGQIVEAASEYVDFSKFDANGNGKLEKYELCFAFILGGAETSSGGTTYKEAFGFHAYYKDYDPDNVVTMDGVEIGRAGFFGTGAISGGAPLNFGVFAHELGHYLGAPDMYDTSGTKYDLAVGSASMMASGSHGDAPYHFDPYMLAEFGFYAPETISADGEYTLYSKASEKGEYNILKLATPNPGEYFLIENRYSSIKDGSTFDRGVKQGILVWHVDENIHKKTGMTCNASSHGYDPTIVVYTPLKSETSKENALAGYGAFLNNNSNYPNYAVFRASSYTFPVSKTWYTSMTDAEAEQIKELKVEVISAPGDETKVRITGSYKQELPPEISMNAYDWTKNSVTIKGELETLNYSTMTSAKFTLSEKATGTVVKEQDIKFAPDYTYEILCDGLKPGTSYEYKIVAESSHGQLVISDSNYTKPEEVKKVTVTMVINSDNYKTSTQQATVGKEFVVRVQLNKYGHYFDGWYLDEAYTKPYTPGIIEGEEDFTIYAKWVAGTDPSKTTASTVGTTSTTASTTTATTAPTTDNTHQGGMNSTTIVIIAVAAVVVVGGGVTAALIAGKSAKRRK